MRKEDLQNLEPFGVTTASVTSEVRTNEPPGAFSITVEGIDEFTNQEDWVGIWKRHIVPHQNTLWERRGSKPAGRKTYQLETLRNWLPVYRSSLVTGSVEKTLNEFQKAEAPEGTLDTKRAGEMMAELNYLLRPV